VLHRAPGATAWEIWELDRAMDRIAELVKKTRDETFVERLPDGKLVNQTLAMFSLGGATMDNEWNHVQQKLMRGLADPRGATWARPVTLAPLRSLRGRLERGTRRLSVLRERRPAQRGLSCARAGA
jgi:formate dehydrogenase major subunit